MSKLWLFFSIKHSVSFSLIRPSNRMKRIRSMRIIMLEKGNKKNSQLFIYSKAEVKFEVENKI